MPEIQSMMWWMWIVAGLLLALAEALSGGEFFLFLLGCAAALTGLTTVAGITEPLWAQLVAFCVFALITVVFVRKRLKSRLKAAIPDREVDSIVGQRVVVVAAVPEGGVGKVELRGTNWNARHIGSEALAEGRACVVERVDGLTLWVRGEGS